MPTPAERLVMLMEAHDDSLRSAAERCSLDHTTLIRVKGGETENPATLAKIAEGYGVPVAWMRGDRDLATDFMCAVIGQPLQERVMFLWQPESRLGFAVQFLREYSPKVYTVERLASLLKVPDSAVRDIIDKGFGTVTSGQLEHLSTEAGLPPTWFSTGLIGWEDEKEMLVGLATKAIFSLSARFGISLSEEEIHDMALALV